MEKYLKFVIFVKKTPHKKWIFTRNSYLIACIFLGDPKGFGHLLDAAIGNHHILNGAVPRKQDFQKNPAFLVSAVSYLPSVFMASIFRTTSIPLSTLPKTTCLPSNQLVAFTVIKNWEPFVSLPALAIESHPAP